MNVSIELLIEAIVTAIRNPAANVMVTALLLAALVTIALIIVIALILLVLPKRRVVRVRRRAPVAVEPSPDDDATYVAATHVPEGDEAAPDRTELIGGSSEAAESSPDGAPRGPSRAGAMLGGLAAPVLIGLAVIAGYVVTGTQVYCAESCHADQVAVVAAVDTEHATCVGCHEIAGVLGAPANIVSRGRMAVSWIQGEDAPDAAVVDSESCLGCHEEVLQRTITTSRIRMSHQEPADSGLTCVQCHPDTGHTVDTRYTMSSCLPCHDGENATTECGTCHIVDPYSTFSDPTAESAVPLDRAVYPLVRFDDVGCGGCHNEVAECDTCHGLRMPHSDEFIDGAHAKDAAFERKELCFRCHQEDWCSTGCHIGFPGHADNWKLDHQSAPWDAGCGCHQARSGREGPMCVLCH